MYGAPSEFQKTLKLGDLHHGMNLLQGIRISRYNSMLREGRGFVGDQANKGAFQERIKEWRSAGWQKIRWLHFPVWGLYPILNSTFYF